MASLAPARLFPSKQRIRSDPERSREAADNHHSRISHAALNSRYIGAIESRLEPETLLRHSPQSSNAPDVLADQPAQIHAQAG